MAPHPMLMASLALFWKLELLTVSLILVRAILNIMEMRASYREDVVKYLDAKKKQGL